MMRMTDTNEIQVKPWDKQISRSVLLDVANDYFTYLNYGYEFLMDDVDRWFGKDADLSRDVLRFENLEGKIIGFAGLTTYSGKVPNWWIHYAILPEYIQSSLPRILIESSISLGKRNGVDQLIFSTMGPLSEPFDIILRGKGLNPAQSLYAVRQDYQ